MKNILLVLSALALFLTSISCNESSLLGADLFEGEKLNLQFTDTLTINALTEKTDSVLVYSTAPYYYDSLPCGKVNDPFFGLTEARIYSQFRFDSTIIPTVNLSVAVIDSAFLDLVYNGSPSRIYGDTLNPQTLGIYRLTQAIPSETIYSNRIFSTEATPIGKYTFSPKPYTQLVSITKKDTTRFSGRVRIPLDKNFSKQLLDTNNLKNITTWLKGLEIRSEATTNTMLNFNFGVSTTNPTAIRLYYRIGTTDTLSLTIPINTTHFANFKNGYDAAPIKPFINNQKATDSLMFIQSMAGTNVKIEFPYLKNLGKVVINKAELEITVSKDSKTDIFPPIDQLLLRTAQFSAVQDVRFDSNYGDGISTRPREQMSTSGGFVRTETVSGTTVQKYYFNLSTHLQQMLEGKQGSNLYITPHFKEEKGSRVVLYGPKSSKYRAKLNIHYTKL